MHPSPPNFYIKISVVLLLLKILRFSVVFYIKIPVVLSSIKNTKDFSCFFRKDFVLMFTSNFIMGLMSDFRWGKFNVIMALLE